jgi:glutamyl-tRNA(Gln) amidotransferase subunit E
MYPDTDSAPIPLEDSTIDRLGSNLPQEVIDRYHIMQEWGIPEDTYTYIFKKDLFPLIERIIKELGYQPAFVGTLFGHKLKFVEGHSKPAAEFNYRIVYGLLKFLKERGLTPELSWLMLSHVYEHPKLDFESVLTSIKFKKVGKDELLSKLPFLKTKFAEIQINQRDGVEKDWIMGQLRRSAIGNVELTELASCF